MLWLNCCSIGSSPSTFTCSLVTSSLTFCVSVTGFFFTDTSSFTYGFFVTSTSSLFSGTFTSVLDGISDDAGVLSLAGLLSITASSCVTGTSTSFVSVIGSFVIVASPLVDSLLETSKSSSITGIVVPSVSDLTFSELCLFFPPLFVLLAYVPAAPCSYSLPVSAAPVVPLAMPFFLAISTASSGLVLVCPGSVIFSLISLLTAVGSCSLIFAGVIGSFSLYDVNGSSLMPISVPAAPCSYAVLPLELEEVSFELVLLITLSLVVSPTSFTLSLAPVTVSLTFSIILPIIILYTLRY